MMALTYSNTLFSWGAGGYGENGLGDLIDSNTPVQVQVHFSS